VLRHLPNLICLFRIALVWPVVQAIHTGRYGLALALFVVAAVSDGLDGFLAKRFNWTSELGKFLDPLADKLLLVAVFVTASWVGIVPWWLAAAAIARDVVIGLGALIFWLWFGPLRGRPTLVSKVNTLLQILVLSVAVLQAAWPVWPAPVLAALVWATLVTTVASGLHYVWQFLARAWNLPARAA
jgi:cardiolipin synthase (CMP-forming)